MVTIQDKTYTGLLPLQASTDKIYHRLSTKGHTDIQLILAIASNWLQIIEPTYAPYCHPSSIHYPKNNSGGVLSIKVSHPSVALFLQSQQQHIIERINLTFGFQSIVSLKII